LQGTPNIEPAGRDLARLMSLARQGSSDAMGQLLEAYRPFLLAVAAAELDGELTAKAGPSDVVQETCIEAHRDFAMFQSDKLHDLKAWLHAILMNNLADLRKRFLRVNKRLVRRERPLPDGGSQRFFKASHSPPESPSNAALTKEERDSIEAAMNRLSAAHREVIIMRCREGRSFQEIADAIGRSSDAARMLWNRAVLQLKKILEESER
jgi:RNA polymerase sigma-70 factor (ECF subfamily)